MTVVLHAALWPLIIAFAVALFAGPIVKLISISFDFYDKPDGGLKSHDRPIPYLGGVAIYAGWLTALISAMTSHEWKTSGLETGSSHSQFIWIAVGGTLLMLTGLIDDLRHLPPKLRLLVQAGVAGILIFGGIGGGVGAQLLQGILGMSIPSALLILLSLLFCAFVIAGASNSTNVIDGMDGLCAGIIGIAALGFVILATCLVQQSHLDLTNAWRIVIVAVALWGTCAAFLIFNFNPASMFMGDSGSLLLGFSVATIMILFAEYAGWRGLIGSAIVFGFPIFDMALAVTRRRLAGRPLFRGDRSHFYDQIRDRGFSIRKTVLICYALGAAFATVGMLSIFLPVKVLGILVVVTPPVGFVLCKRLGLLRVDDSAKASH